MLRNNYQRLPKTIKKKRILEFKEKQDSQKKMLEADRLMKAVELLCTQERMKKAISVVQIAHSDPKGPTGPRVKSRMVTY